MCFSLAELWNIEALIARFWKDEIQKCIVSFAAIVVLTLFGVTMFALAEGAIRLDTTIHLFARWL